MSGTVHIGIGQSVSAGFRGVLVLQIGKDSVEYSLRISVRTELIRLIVLAFTLAPSCAPPPKEGSFWAALPQPTVLRGMLALLCFESVRVRGRDGWCLEVTYCVRGSGLLRGLQWRL